MSFLKTLFWIVLSAVVVLFSINNWLPVTVNLWGGLQADVKLPLLLFVFFLVGFVPTIIYYRTKTWRMSKRLDTVSRQLHDERGLKAFRAPQRSTEAEANPITPESETTTGEELRLTTPAPEADKA
jgi:H+/Cl- antiporter ClcA